MASARGASLMRGTTWALALSGLLAIGQVQAQERVWGQENQRIQILPPDPTMGDPSAYVDPFAPSDEPPPAPELLEAPAAPAARTQAGEAAHLRFLDRRTSTRGALVSPVGSTARYGRLIIEVLACHREIEGDDSAAFLRIREEAAPAESPPVFSGWMFALSPSLSALDHSRYDVWVAECKTAEGSQSAENR